MPKDFEEEDFYDEEGLEEMVDDGEISPEEEGFMRGYERAHSEKKEDRDYEEEIE